MNGLAVSAWTAAAGEGTLAGGNLIDGQWVHVVHVSGETNRFLYINGVQVASGASSPDARGQAAFNFNIGGSGIWDAADNWFRGQIDEVAVFSVALEPDEVAALADRSATPLTLRQPGGGGTNILVNSSFEEPVLSNVNTNNLGTVPTGWSQTGADATWNLIRNDGSAYGSGVDNAADGNQIIDLNGLFELFQNFTLTEASNVTFGASFANREGHDGSAPSRVGIYDASGTTLLSPEVSVDTSADPTPSDVWRSGEATVKNLPAGEYQIRIALNNFNNVDAVYANVSPATGGGGGGGGGGDRPSAIGEVVAEAGGMTSLTFSSEAGVAYDVERSVDLIDWSVVASPAGADGTTSTMVSVGNDGPIAFYRVVKK